jgi:hypothetical protein
MVGFPSPPLFVVTGITPNEEDSKIQNSRFKAQEFLSWSKIASGVIISCGRCLKSFEVLPHAGRTD